MIMMTKNDDYDYDSKSASGFYSNINNNTIEWTTLVVEKRNNPWKLQQSADLLTGADPEFHAGTAEALN